jgi:COP9 signalosome complex subunit 6
MEENMLVEGSDEAQPQAEMELDPLLSAAEVLIRTEDVDAEDSSMKPEANKSVMANASIAVNSVSVFLHPLVIMNISEHWTWMRAKHSKIRPIYGALIGKQKGRSIEIMNSFELLWLPTGDTVTLDTAYYSHKEEQFKQVFPELDFLGWYTIGDSPTESDIDFQRQICEINESPVLLKLNPFVRTLFAFLCFKI